MVKLFWINYSAEEFLKEKGKQEYGNEEKNQSRCTFHTRKHEF